MILLIDNYDSFAHNLARYMRQLGQTVRVARNDELSLEDIRKSNPAAIVMSPGPCTPDEAGICLDAIEHFADSIPILGVCLGHQAICQAFGGSIVRTTPVHGQAGRVSHAGHPLFNDIDSTVIAGRYHSLVIKPDTVLHPLETIATSPEGIVMAVAHHQKPVVGVQFHPESILTLFGYQLLNNFLRLAGLATDESRVRQLTNQLADQTVVPNDDSSPTPFATHPW